MNSSTNKYHSFIAITSRNIYILSRIDDIVKSLILLDVSYKRLFTNLSEFGNKI